jgi:sporulation protein YlmC with PRC-barrel domain
MKRVSFRELKKMTVETASGKLLGKVSNLVLEMDGQLIAQYIVKPSMTQASGWKSEKYMISRDQIIRLEEKKIIVSDGAADQKIQGGEGGKKLGISAEPIVMVREESKQ